MLQGEGDPDFMPITVAVMAPQGSGKTYAVMSLIGELCPVRQYTTLLYLCSNVTYDSPANALLREHVHRHQVINERWNIKSIFEQAMVRYAERRERTVVVLDDLADEIFDGDIDIGPLAIRGRHAGIDTFILLQGRVVAGRRGKVIRKNVTDVLAFRTCCIDLLDFAENKKEQPALLEYIQRLRDDEDRVGVVMANNTVNAARQGSPEKRLAPFKAGVIKPFHIPNGATAVPVAASAVPIVAARADRSSSPRRQQRDERCEEGCQPPGYESDGVMMCYACGFEIEGDEEMEVDEEGEEEGGDLEGFIAPDSESEEGEEEGKESDDEWRPPSSDDDDDQPPPPGAGAAGAAAGGGADGGGSSRQRKPPQSPRNDPEPRDDRAPRYRGGYKRLTDVELDRLSDLMVARFRVFTVGTAAIKLYTNVMNGAKQLLTESPERQIRRLVDTEVTWLAKGTVEENLRIFMRSVPRAKPEDLRVGLEYFSLIHIGGPNDVFEIADEMMDEDSDSRETMVQAMLGNMEAKDICKIGIDLAHETRWQ